MSKKTQLFLMILATVTLFALPAFAAGESYGFPWKYWFAGMFNLAIFLGIIVYVGAKPIKQLFHDRRETFLKNMNAAKAAREEAEARLAELNEKLELLEKERQALLDEYHAQGEREKQRLVETAKKQVEKMRSDAEATIDQEVKKAVAMLEEQAVDLAVGLAREKAVKRLDAAAQDRLFDGFIADLGEEKSRLN